MDYGALLGLLGRSLWSQGYRPVDLSTISTGPIQFSSGTADLDAALKEVGSDPNWLEVARQLTALKVQGFGQLWLRRDTYDLELACAYGWTGTLHRSAVEPYVRYVWDSIRPLAHQLGSFSLDGNNLGVLLQAAAAEPATVQAAQTKTAAAPPDDGTIPAGEDNGPLGQQKPDPSANPPATANGGSSPLARLVNLVLALHFARTPTAVMLGIGLGGLDPALVDEVQRAANNPFIHKDPLSWSIVAPTSCLGLINGVDLSVHGQTMPHSLDLPQLGRTLSFLAAHG